MSQPRIKTGLGLDAHAFAENRTLILGGVLIPYEKGLMGHSDADVLCHAISDALLGAAGLGDIGQHFPDTDPIYFGASSIMLLQCCAEKVRQSGYAVGNVDAVVIAQDWPAYRAYDASYCPGAGHRACAGEYQGNYDRAYGLYGTQGGHSGPGGMLIGKD